MTEQGAFLSSVVPGHLSPVGNVASLRTAQNRALGDISR